MPDQLMSPLDRSVSNPAGFYGKIPAVGDFINRRLSQTTIFVWDSWLRHSLYESRNSPLFSHATDAPHRRMIWNFIVPASICGESLIGMITPSCDRVGRQFPFTLVKPLAIESGTFLCPSDVADFFTTHQVILSSIGQRKLNIQQLEAALSESCGDRSPAPIPCQSTSSSSMSIPGDMLDVFKFANDHVDPSASSVDCRQPIPWTDLDLSRVNAGNTSYWWRNAAGIGPMKAFTHTGGLNQTLFNALFSSAT